jgi:hypothetical protein
MILEHLGLPRRTRRIRPRLRVLTEMGALAASRAGRTDLWSLTAAGRGCLWRAGEIDLPESPQHQRWRAARTLAEQEIRRFHSAMADVLVEATALLDGTGSDGWFEMADRLPAAARQLGSATYCLREWPEPSDDGPDIDDLAMPGDELLDPGERGRWRRLRFGRRDTTLRRSPR